MFGLIYLNFIGYTMHLIDFVIIAAYFAASFGIAMRYSKRAGKSADDFFLSGRALPWYLAGLSMVATTFAADTPLAVTELVALHGVSGNWVWWNFVFGGLLTVFFFARLWRRAGIMTEAEFSEIRYSGKPAKFLRGFRSIYLGLFMNIIIIGWVNRAMLSILTGMFGISEGEALIYVGLSLLMVAVYSSMAGLWGVVVTDAFQFIFAMGGCIVLAILVISSDKIGGITGLQQKLDPSMFSFFPQIGDVTSHPVKMFSVTVTSFLAYIGIQWWASWYPGAEPGGGGYIAQRIMSAKDEKHSLLATLFFQVAHYALRPWPWILVGLASLVLYPDLTDKKMGYIYAMKDFLPIGLKGLLVASFFAAYMSTISTQLNWGASYLLNDLYRRFMKPSQPEEHYVSAARVITILLMLVSIPVTVSISRISGAWEFILECGAGLGLVLILRWFWWRINAWSEISAMVAPFVMYPFLKSAGIAFPESLFYLTGFTTIVWITVTALTRPEDNEILVSFYRRARPGGVLWKKISDTLPDVQGDTGFASMFMNWFAGVILVYSMLFGIGSFIFLRPGEGLIYTAVAAGAFYIIYKNLARLGWKSLF